MSPFHCVKPTKLLRRGGLLLASPLVIAAIQPDTSVWAPHRADRIANASKACTGGEYSRPSGEAHVRRRDISEIVRALPLPGERVGDISSDRASDIYTVAMGLLAPAIPNAERALDPGSFLKCSPDPEAAVELLTFLAADGPANRQGPNNIFYWLGMAYRRGVGVGPDAAQAQSMFLKARILGQTNLTSEDWGAHSTDTLPLVLSRPANRAILEQTASAGRGEAQLLLADLVLPTDKEKARSLLRAAVAQRNIAAIRRLAKLDAEGAFGEPDYLEATRLLASIARLGDDDYNSMLAAASAFNRGDVVNDGRVVTLAVLGGESLYTQLRTAKLDSIGGRVPARGLVAPDGHIIFTEDTDPSTRQFAMAKETLRVFSPQNLRPIAPSMVGRRAVFAWVNLPAIDWR